MNIILFKSKLWSGY